MEHESIPAKLDGWVNFRVEQELKQKLNAISRAHGFRKLSDYLRREIDGLVARETAPRGKKRAA